MTSFIVVEYDKRDPFDQALTYVLADAERALRVEFGLPEDEPESESCDHNDAGPCPTCDYCGRSQCVDDRYWNGDTGCHVECESVAALAEAEYVRAKDRHDRLVDRYNREYREGRWSTNRDLAGKCEDAYDAMYAALAVWRKLDPSAPAR